MPQAYDAVNPKFYLQHSTNHNNFNAFLCTNFLVCCFSSRVSRDYRPRSLTPPDRDRGMPYYDRETGPSPRGYDYDRSVIFAYVFISVL